jgi:hypothetical protein
LILSSSKLDGVTIVDGEVLCGVQAITVDRAWEQSKAPLRLRLADSQLTIEARGSVLIGHAGRSYTLSMVFDAIARVIISGAFAGKPSHSKAHSSNASKPFVNDIMNRLVPIDQKSVEWIDRGVAPVLEDRETFVRVGGPD